jgi:hypothetical protein
MEYRRLSPPNFYPSYVMEYLSGGSLRQHMEKNLAEGMFLKESGQSTG